ncbi:MAG: hypothetical protein ACYC2H_07280 [Thermoplasmatota archaeon]
MPPMDLIDHAIRLKTGPLYGLTRVQAVRIWNYLAEAGFFDDFAPKEVLCESCMEPRQVIAVKCPGRGCPSPKQETPKLKARNRWQVSPEAEAEALHAA